MAETSRVAPDLETPVNPYSLLEALNRASDRAHTGWLVFLGVLAYLATTTAAVTHKDLLLATPVTLPILGVSIGLERFFELAPLVLLFVHMGLLTQLALLARQSMEFDAAVRFLETTDQRTHALRLELPNFFLVQRIAGPHRSRVLSAFLAAVSWLTVAVLPVMLLLFIQTIFLPYHDIGITWSHRLVLIADLAMLALVGVFLVRSETSFFQALGRMASQRPAAVFAGGLFAVVAALSSFFVATVPGEGLDRLAQSTLAGRRLEAGGDGRLTQGFGLPFVASRLDGTLLGVFDRNLRANDLQLVPTRKREPGDVSLSLRDRDLRYARLDRSALARADFTGADLQGASLTGADLTGALFTCALPALPRESVPGEVEQSCTSARRASFAGARLDGANLSGADLRSALFEAASLEGAVLAGAQLQGANFTGAHLAKAGLGSTTRVQGAKLVGADLSGADLSGAGLEGADLTSATLSGASLVKAGLEGAVLRNARLEAASFAGARLFGADLTGAVTGGTDMRGARVWQSVPPEADPALVSDFTGLAVRAPDEAELAGLKTVVAGLDSLKVREAVVEALGPVLDQAPSQAWQQSADVGRWQALAAATSVPATADEFKSRHTDYLARMMCRPGASGAIATGIARRAAAAGFQGDPVAVSDRLAASDCPAGKQVRLEVLRDLAAAADRLRGR